MAFVRTETEVIPESRREKQIKTCDICGGDATDRTQCRVCKKDLCADHQIDVLSGLRDGNYAKEFPSGIYCKQCLLGGVTKFFA